jgi:hypothetical protein
MSRRRRTRRLGTVTVQVRHRDGAACGSVLHWRGRRFNVPAWPSRIVSAEPRGGDAIAVRTSDGRERLVFAEDAA